jgi:CRISPR-associated protein Cas1
VTSPWRILDFCDFHGRVTAGKGFLKADGQSVALVDIAVVLIGVDVDLHSSVFDRAAAFSFPILHCDWRNVPIAVTWPWSTNTRVAARHLAQAEMEAPKQKNAWMRIVKAKIAGQSFNLRNDREGSLYLTNLVSKVRSGDPSNCEGQAARYYWRRLYNDKAFRRIPGSLSSVNGMLDYGYTILRGTVVRSILSAGLWPTLGVWHRNRSNVFALADDLIEPFRPAVDAVVAKIVLRTTTLDREGKRDLVQVLDSSFTPSGYTVTTELNRIAQNFARYAEGIDRVLEVPKFSHEA